MDIDQLRPIAERLFSAIHRLSFDGVGITRESYGQGENLTAEFLREFAREEGLRVQNDRAGNLHFTLQEVDAGRPSVWCGSHLDSVPQGGNYDGLAGVIAGLLCLIAQRRSPETTGHYPLTVVALRGEESAWFGKPYLGSGALLGKLNAGDLQLTNFKSRRTLAEALSGVGADVDAILRQEMLVDLQDIRAYLELHIEQGPLLMEKDLPVAIVSAIRGNMRHSRISCLGVAGHSGAVPRELRQDTVFAFAELVMRIDAHWQRLLRQGADLVVTTGIVMTDTHEHAITRIPSKVSFSCDMRSQSLETLEQFYRLLREEAGAIGQARGVCFEFDQRVSASSAMMDRGIHQQLLASARSVQLQPFTMPSGAGHDAALFASAGVPTGMIFIRNQHGSHNPAEAMDLDDFMQGVRLLHHAIRYLE